MATKFTATRTSIQARTDLDADASYWNSGLRSSYNEALAEMLAYLTRSVEGWDKLGKDGANSREALALTYFEEQGPKGTAEEIIVDGIKFRINSW